LMDGKEYDGEIKGTDPNTDLAVIKIDAKDLPALKFGDSDKARVGEWVLAIGSPLSEELAHTVTSGIISAKGRTGLFDQRQYEDFIQTDAAINPGNSGGALVNLRGELVGINTAIASRNGGFMGIGFAIPSNLANKVMTDILEKGRVVRGWLGVYIQDINSELANALGLSSPNGVLISGVQENSPAEKAGLKSEDVVLKFNDRPVKNSQELRTLVASAGPDTKIRLGILRDGKDKEIEAKLGELTEEVAASSENTEASQNVGMQVSDITPQLVEKYNLKVEKDAVVITDVENGSVADQSNLKPGDVILKVNRQTVKSVSDYNKILKSTKPGETLLLYIQRDEARIFVAFTIPEK
jgi:serine protease Do